MMRTEYAHGSILVNALSCLTKNNQGGINSFMTLGERLRIARRHAGLTQMQLAEKSSVPQQTISKIERGDAETSAFVVQLAIACGVRPHWLAVEMGAMEEPPPIDLSADAIKVGQSFDALSEEKKAAYRVLLGEDAKRKDDQDLSSSEPSTRLCA